MKTTQIYLALALFIILQSCSGSENYRGDWKATDPRGNKYEINFEEKSFTLRDESGSVNTYDYSQNEVINESGVMSYGIQLGDGRKLQVRFPFDADFSKGFILDANNHVMYTISRTKYMRYEEVYQL